MAVRYSLQLTGRTAASTLGTATGIIATDAIEVHDDGFIRFTDASGVRRAIPMKGDFGVLMREVLTGTGGVPATEPMFDRPLRTGPGVGGRTDS